MKAGTPFGASGAWLAIKILRQFGSVVGSFAKSGWSNYTIQGIIHAPSTTNWANPPQASTEDSTGGDFNGDGYADTAFLQQRSDGGADVYVLYGAMGTPFQNSTTLVRSLPGSPGWDWTKM